MPKRKFKKQSLCIIPGKSPLSSFHFLAMSNTHQSLFLKDNKIEYVDCENERKYVTITKLYNIKSSKNKREYLGSDYVKPYLKMPHNTLTMGLIEEEPFNYLLLSFHEDQEPSIVIFDCTLHFYTIADSFEDFWVNNNLRAK